MEFESIKRNHTEKIVKLLSEKYLNNFSPIIFSKFTAPRKVVNELYTRLINLMNRHSTNYYDNLLNPIADLMRKNLDFIDLLDGYFNKNQFPQMSISKFGIKEEKEAKKLSNLISNEDLSNENQTMVFQNIPIQQVYREAIVVVSNFTLNRSSEPNNNLRSTSTLYYNVVLPFQNSRYPETYPRCTSQFNLPPFFSLH